MRFQFLLVRLKAENEEEYEKKLELFQFLLVRLKDCQQIARPFKNKISIPFGAIKSIQLPRSNLKIRQHFNSFWCD